MSLYLSFGAIIFCVIVDQITKWLAVQYLQPIPEFPLIPDVFVLKYAQNTGIGFSLLENKPWIFIPVSMAIMALVLVMMMRSPLRRHPLFASSTALIVAGAFGNLIDRIFNGYVVDFLYVKLINFPIFNVADCCVVIGAILLFIFIMFCLKEEEDTPMLTLFFGIPMRGKNHE